MRKLLMFGVAFASSGGVSAQSSATYEYDALGRLTASSNRAGSADVRTTITYDAAGNRVNYAVAGAPAGNGDPNSGPAATASRRFVVVPLNGFTVIPIN